MTLIRNPHGDDARAGFPGGLVSQSGHGEVANGRRALATALAKLEQATPHIAAARRLIIPSLQGPFTATHGSSITFRLTRFARPTFARRITVVGFYSTKSEGNTGRIEMLSGTQTWTDLAADLPGTPDDLIIYATSFAGSKLIGDGTKNSLGVEDIDIRLSLSDSSSGDTFTVWSLTAHVDVAEGPLTI